MSIPSTQSFQSSCPCNIIIIGAGLAGLASALALNQVGHRVTILERTPELLHVGAGIQLSPNATRILHKLGVLADITPHAYQPETGSLRSWHNGSSLARSLPPASVIEKTYKAPYIVVHRANLLAVLVSAATARGVSVRLGCEVVELDLSQKAAVRLSSGEYIDCDVLLGADGERSFCRDVLLGRSDLPKPTGDVVFRIVVSRSDILADKSHPSWEIVQQGSVNVWMGPDAHAVSYLLNNNDILNIVLIRKDDMERPEDVMYGPQHADLEDVQRAFDSWDPALRALLEVPGQSACIKWNLLQINELAGWAHEGGAPFCLIGDAAHGMPPYLAQGAAMAFEDAAVLGAIFARVSDKTQILDALKVFEAVRKPRTDKVKERTLARKVMYDMPDGLEQQERDEKIALGPGNWSPDELAVPDFQNWLWGYDAAADGAQAWEQYLR